MVVLLWAITALNSQALDPVRITMTLARFHSRFACSRAAAALFAACAIAGTPSRLLAQSLPSSPQQPTPFVRTGDQRLPTFKRIEQGISDTGPLRASLRNLGVDLLVPTGFRDVFEIQPAASPSLPGFQPNSDTQKRFARVNGAVVAVFPRSVYTPTDDGIVAELPSGTIFYVGGLPRNFGLSSLGRLGSTDASTPTSPLWADLRADTSVKSGDAGRRSVGASGPVPLTSASLVATNQTPQQPVANTARPRPALDSAASPHLASTATTPQGIMTDDSLRQRVVQALLKSAVTPSTPTDPPSTSVGTPRADKPDPVQTEK